MSHIRCRCVRCGADLPAGSDRQRVAVIGGQASGQLWRADGPWPYADLCRRCARGLAHYLEAGPVHQRGQADAG